MERTILWFNCWKTILESSSPISSLSLKRTICVGFKIENFKNAYVYRWMERASLPCKIFSFFFVLFFFFIWRSRRRVFTEALNLSTPKLPKQPPNPPAGPSSADHLHTVKLRTIFQLTYNPAVAAAPLPPPPLQAFLTEVNDYDLTGETDDLTASGY